MAVIDTDVLIDFLKDQNDAKEILQKLLENETLYVTPINEYELLKGAHLSKHPQKHIGEVERFLSKFQLLILDKKSIDIAATTFSDLAKQGQKISDLDVLIASICISNNETLVTRNVKHFSRIPELDLYKQE
jgi:predicted nucleic acid-binding protein